MPIGASLFYQEVVIVIPLSTDVNGNVIIILYHPTLYHVWDGITIYRTVPLYISCVTHLNKLHNLMNCRVIQCCIRYPLGKMPICKYTYKCFKFIKAITISVVESQHNKMSCAWKKNQYKTIIIINSSHATTNVTLLISAPICTTQ